MVPNESHSGYIFAVCKTTDSLQHSQSVCIKLHFYPSKLIHTWMAKSAQKNKQKKKKIGGKLINQDLLIRSKLLKNVSKDSNSVHAK